MRDIGAILTDNIENGVRVASRTDKITLADLAHVVAKGGEITDELRERAVKANTNIRANLPNGGRPYTGSTPLSQAATAA